MKRCSLNMGFYSLMVRVYQLLKHVRYFCDLCRFLRFFGTFYVFCDFSCDFGHSFVNLLGFFCNCFVISYCDVLQLFRMFSQNIPNFSERCTAHICHYYEAWLREAIQVRSVAKSERSSGRKMSVCLLKF